MSDLGSVLRVFAAGLLLLSFATPLRGLWEQRGAPWWAPFALWAAAILALFFAARARPDKRGGPDP